MDKLARFFSFQFCNIFFIFSITFKILCYDLEIGNSYYHVIHFFPIALTSVLTFISFSILFNRQTQNKLLLLLNLLITFLIISDINYYRYFKDILSIPVLKNGILLSAVKTSVASVFKFYDLFYFIDILFFIFFLKNKKYNGSKEYSFSLRLLFFLVIFLLSGSFTGYKIFALSLDQPRLISTMYNKLYIARELGCIDFHGLDLYNFISTRISDNKPIPKEKEVEIKNFLQSSISSENTYLKNVAKGQNLIVIQVEALQNFVINSKIEGNEVTPNLNKWMKKSVYFNNFFYQVSAGGTSDAEFLLNNSLYPAPTGAAYYLYSSNTYDSLAEALHRDGYSTSVMHGYKETFWNRNIMYKALHFDNFYSEKSYNIDENVGLGLSDKSFLTQTVDKIKSLPSPYYDFIITLSSHFPYDDTMKYGEFNVSQYENSLLGNYLKAIHYTDAQLGLFLETLEKEGIADNAIIVLYGDHNGIPKEHQNELAAYMDIKEMTDIEWAKLQKVPLLIHFPKEAYTGINTCYGGQVDLSPTLSNLFNLPKNGLLGKDLFNTKENFILFRNGSFSDGTTFYLSDSDTYFDIQTNKKIEENTLLKTEKEKTLNTLEFSDLILKHNLLEIYNKSK